MPAAVCILHRLLCADSVVLDVSLYMQCHMIRSFSFIYYSPAVEEDRIARRIAAAVSLFCPTVAIFSSELCLEAVMKLRQLFLWMLVPVELQSRLDLFL